MSVNFSNLMSSLMSGGGVVDLFISQLEDGQISTVDYLRHVTEIATRKVNDEEDECLDIINQYSNGSYKVTIGDEYVTVNAADVLTAVRDGVDTITVGVKEYAVEDILDNVSEANEVVEVHKMALITLSQMVTNPMITATELAQDFHNRCQQLSASTTDAAGLLIQQYYDIFTQGISSIKDGISIVATLMGVNGSEYDPSLPFPDYSPDKYVGASVFTTITTKTDEWLTAVEQSWNKLQDWLDTHVTKYFKQAATMASQYGGALTGTQNSYTLGFTGKKAFGNAGNSIIHFRNSTTALSDAYVEYLNEFADGHMHIIEVGAALLSLWVDKRDFRFVTNVSATGDLTNVRFTNVAGPRSETVMSPEEYAYLDTYITYNRGAWQDADDLGDFTLEELGIVADGTPVTGDRIDIRYYRNGLITDLHLKPVNDAQVKRARSNYGLQNKTGVDAIVPLISPLTTCVSWDIAGRNYGIGEYLTYLTELSDQYFLPSDREMSMCLTGSYSAAYDSLMYFFLGDIIRQHGNVPLMYVPTHNLVANLMGLRSLPRDQGDPTRLDKFGWMDAQTYTSTSYDLKNVDLYRGLVGVATGFGQNGYDSHPDLGSTKIALGLTSLLSDDQIDITVAYLHNTKSYMYRKTSFPHCAYAVRTDLENALYATGFTLAITAAVAFVGLKLAVWRLKRASKDWAVARGAFERANTQHLWNKDDPLFEQAMRLVRREQWYSNILGTIASRINAGLHAALAWGLFKIHSGALSVASKASAAVSSNHIGSSQPVYTVNDVYQLIKGSLD